MPSALKNSAVSPGVRNCLRSRFDRVAAEVAQWGERLRITSGNQIGCRRTAESGKEFLDGYAGAIFGDVERPGRAYKPTAQRMNVYDPDKILTEVDSLRRQYSNDAPDELLVLLALQRIHPILVKMAAYYSTTRGISLQSLIDERLKTGDFREFSRLTRSQLIDLADREAKARGRRYASTNEFAFALTSGEVKGIRELLSQAGVDPDELQTWILRIFPYRQGEPSV